MSGCAHTTLVLQSKSHAFRQKVADRNLAARTQVLFKEPREKPSACTPTPNPRNFTARYSTFLSPRIRNGAIVYRYNSEFQRSCKPDARRDVRER